VSLRNKLSQVRGRRSQAGDMEKLGKQQMGKEVKNEDMERSVRIK
jgi:hypothetical protein